VTPRKPGDLPPSIEAAWSGPEAPRRGPRPGLTLDGIVEAAIEVAVAEGLGAVSMSRVARELGASTMALYRYVSAKDELLALMVDRAIGRPAAPSGPDEGWREGLSRWAWGVHDAYRRHRWVLRIPITSPPPTPNQVAWLEDGLRSLRNTGLAEHEKPSVVLLLSGYVRNEAVLQADLEEGFMRAAGSPDEAMSRYSRTLMRLTDPDRERFPALRAVLEAGVFDHADDPDDEFRFGLARILDGVEVLVSERG
jgi:AcrR family transcriptional regulator